MSYPETILGQIERISAAKQAIKEAINSKGGDLTNELIDQYATAIANLPEGADVTLGVVDANGKFQAFSFNGTTPSDSGSPETVVNYKTWNSTLPAPTPSGGGMDDLEFFDWMCILGQN